MSKRIVFYDLEGNEAYRSPENPETITIGRESDRDFIIRNGLVSRKHCLIQIVEKNYAIRDTSRNGTFVNGTKIESCPLQSGDMINIGPISIYRFEIENSDT